MASSAARLGEAPIDRVEQPREVELEYRRCASPSRHAPESIAGALEVPCHPTGIAAHPVDVGGGQLDEALDEVAFGRIVGAHPGRLHQLVRLEEVAVGVGVQAGDARPRSVPRPASGR